jgi:hypothetical protein
MSEVQETELPREAQSRAAPITDAMSAAADKGERPSNAFEAMPPNTPAPKKDTFGGDATGLKLAAAELQMHREAKAPPVPREYGKTVNGEFTGEKSDITQTIDLERASQDLADQRRAERHAQEALEGLERAKEIDKFRSDADAADRGLPAPEQLQPQPTEVAAETAPANTLAEKYARLDPELKAAVEQQAMAAEQARAQYSQAAQMLVQGTEAALLAQWPELRGVTAQQLPAVLHGINSRDPQRASQIVQSIQQAQQNIAAAQQHQAAEAQRQQQQAAQQFQTYAKAQDSEFEIFKQSRPAGEARAVRDNIAKVLTEDFGIDQEALLQIYNSNPAFRSSQAQRLIYMAVRASLAEKAVRNTPKGLPPVSVRPGASYDHASGESVVASNKMRAFNADPTAKNAGVALAARRRAAALNRR